MMQPMTQPMTYVSCAGLAAIAIGRGPRPLMIPIALAGSSFAPIGMGASRQIPDENAEERQRASATTTRGSSTVGRHSFTIPIWVLACFTRHYPLSAKSSFHLHAMMSEGNSEPRDTPLPTQHLWRSDVRGLCAIGTCSRLVRHVDTFSAFNKPSVVSQRGPRAGATFARPSSQLMHKRSRKTVL